MFNSSFFENTIIYILISEEGSLLVKTDFGA